MTTARVLVLSTVVVSAALASGCGRRTADADRIVQTHEAGGVVTASPVDGRVTIAHDAIAGYMPAMTMPFELSGAVPPELAPGVRVRFTVDVTSERLLARDIVVTGRDNAVATAARQADVRPSTRVKKGDVLPAFALQAQDGLEFTDADLRGHRTALTFVFTRCPVPAFCPLVVKRFREVQQELERDASLRDVRLVSVTLDPTFDTPPVLAAYAKAMGARPDRWRFVTGEPAAIARFSRAFAIYAEPNGATIDHTLATAVIDVDGRLADVWRGNGWTVAELVDALRGAAAPGPRP